MNFEEKEKKSVLFKNLSVWIERKWVEIDNRFLRGGLPEKSFHK